MLKTSLSCAPTCASSVDGERSNGLRALARHQGDGAHVATGVDGLAVGDHQGAVLSLVGVCGEIKKYDFEFRLKEYMILIVLLYKGL